MKAVFPGFSEEALKFFRSLEKNNRREWFQPRKEIFDREVKAPMVALVEEVNQGLAKFAPEYITDPGSAIYRIYRDTRFSSDKTPYKTHCGALFKKRGLGKEGGGLYFSFSHKEVEVAGGVYMPGPRELLSIRRHIEEHSAALRKLAAGARLRKLMGDLYGNALTRAPKGFSPDHEAADLLRKKQWLFYVVLDPAIAQSPEIVSVVLDRFKVLVPFVDFLNAPLKVSKASAAELLL